MPASDWFGALTEFAELMITVLVNGAKPLKVPTVSCIPLGLDWKLRPTVRGSSWIEVAAEAPCASVAVSCSSR